MLPLRVTPAWFTLQPSDPHHRFAHAGPYRIETRSRRLSARESRPSHWFRDFRNDRRYSDRPLLPWWAICFTSSRPRQHAHFIGVPAGAYAGNMTFLQLAFGYVIGRVLVSVLFLPSYFRGELFTSYELLLRRFGPEVKNVAAVIFVITRTLADGIRLFATALVISVVTQVPVTITVVALGVAMIIYTVRGGVSAVIWTTSP